MSASESESEAATPPPLYAYDCGGTRAQPGRVMLAEYKTKDTALREQEFVAATADSLVPVER